LGIAFCRALWRRHWNLKTMTVWTLALQLLPLQRRPRLAANGCQHEHDVLSELLTTNFQRIHVAQQWNISQNCSEFVLHTLLWP
jgi:hypothetical protein